MTSLPKTTRAAVLYQPNEPLAVEELELPELQKGQVLIRVHAAGVCSTQLMEVRGEKGPNAFLPHVLGHEASGTCLAVGPEVSRVRAGDRLVVSWIKGPGANAPGAKYRTLSGRSVNSGAAACFMEYAVVAENRCTPVASDLDTAAAALLGCAVPTGAGIVFRQLRLGPADSLIVFGVGGVGLSALMAAVHLGCSRVIAVDVSDEKLEFAKALGATHGVRAEKDGTHVQVLNALTEGGATAVIEASGSVSGMEAAYEVTRREVGRCVLAGNLAKGQTVRIDPFELILGKSLLGSVGGSTQPSEDIPAYARLYKQGKLPLDRLATCFFTLDEINAAFEALEKGVLGRALLRMDAGW